MKYNLKKLSVCIISKLFISQMVYKKGTEGILVVTSPPHRKDTILFHNKHTTLKQKSKKIAKSQSYDKFVDKFKPKPTTDDCYTPPIVYETVLKWCRDNKDLR